MQSARTEDQDELLLPRGVPMKQLLVLFILSFSNLGFGQDIFSVPSTPCPQGAEAEVYRVGKSLSDQLIGVLDTPYTKNCVFSKKREIFQLKYRYHCEKAEVSVLIDYVRCEPNTAKIKSFTVKNADS